MIKKSYLGAAILLVGFAFSFQSCKKGDNDPISLKSRVDRIKGDWSLSKKNVTLTQGVTVGSQNPTSTTINGVYGGGTENIYVNTPPAAPLTYVRKYDFDLSFEVDGTFKYTFNVYRPTGNVNQPYQNYVYITTGVWAWLDQGKDKLGLSLSSDFQPEIPDTLNPGTMLPYIFDGAYNIDRLASDELILKRAGQFTSTVDTVVTNIVYNGTFTFGR